ncbi:MAG: hypothetical protein ACMXYD_03025 [Candidatus Woesearchaeota archaeon]
MRIGKLQGKKDVEINEELKQAGYTHEDIEAALATPQDKKEAPKA